jgi:hypothetical protein
MMQLVQKSSCTNEMLLICDCVEEIPRFDLAANISHEQDPITHNMA